MKRILSSVGAVVIMLLGPTALAGEEATPSAAELFAESEGVSVELADRVLTASPSISAAVEEAHHIQGFAGAWLQWTPEPRLTFAAQTHAVDAIRGILDGGTLPEGIATTVEVVNSDYAELLFAQSEAIRTLVEARLPSVVTVDLRVESNSLQFDVLDSDSFARSLVSAMIETLPVLASLNIVTDPPLMLSATLAGGGLLSNSCTSGFSLRNSSGTKALLSAGHCGNSASQAGVTLGSAAFDTCPAPPLSGQTADRQIHTIPSPNGATNSISLGGPPNPARTILSAVANNSFYVGQPMEKYGRSSGYTTGTVDVVSHSNTTCGGLTELVRATAAVATGDSGGPIFHGSLAFGITQAISTGGTTAFSRIQRSTAGTGYSVCIKANCAP